jgi:N-sulfoglucosamine sulfohydrolase
MTSPQSQHQHRNIVLLIADDLDQYLGCYGSSSIKTPNLDKLASAGTRFNNAFASTASCSGSRSTIYTGLHAHENGQYGLSWFKTHFQTFHHIDSAPKLFNQAGYLTGIIGKVHVGPPEVYPWTVREESGTRDVAWVADRCEVFFQKAKQDDKPFFLTVGYIDPHRDVRLAVALATCPSNTVLECLCF